MDWKKTGKRLLFPPIWAMVLCTAASGAGLAVVFTRGWEETPIAYGIYVLAFYSLSVVCAFFSTVLPKRYRQVKKKVLDNPLGNRYMTDPMFRNHMWLDLSLGVNLLYAAVNVVSFFLQRSWWYICLAVYYGILSVMRFLLVRYVRQGTLGTDRRGELKRSMICAYILLTLNFFLSGAVLMIVYQNKGYEYHGIMIYVMAMYTFYITTHAIINMIKYRAMESPVMSAAKVISMASALVSMLNLETAMFAQFGGQMSKQNQQLMIMLTGAGISAAIIILAVAMIVQCTRELKNMGNYKNGKSE